MKKYIPVIPEADPFAWAPNPDWWDYKSIFENDVPPTGFQKRAIFLYYDSNYKLALYQIAGSNPGTYFRLSDGWEGLYDPNNSYHVWDTSYNKPCDLGYNTRYCIVYTPAEQRDLNLGSLYSSDFNSAHNSILLAYIDDANITNLYCNYSSIEAFITTKKTTVSNTDNWTIGPLRDNYNLQYVILPKGFKKLPDYFLERTAIREIELPEELEEIGSWCFDGCCNLVKITCPDSLIKIGVSAFSNCTSLEKIELNEGLEYIGYYTFSYCPFREIKLPGTLKHIGYFYSCYNLKELSLPEGLETIENGLISGTTPIKELKLPKSLTTINNGVGNCYSLKKLTIDEGFILPGNYFSIPNFLPIPSLCEDFLKKLGDNTNNTTITLYYNNTDAINTYDPTIIPALQAKNYSI